MHHNKNQKKNTMTSMGVPAETNVALLAVAESRAVLETTPHLVHFSNRLPLGGFLKLRVSNVCRVSTPQRGRKRGPRQKVARNKGRENNRGRKQTNKEKTEKEIRELVLIAGSTAC